MLEQTARRLYAERLNPPNLQANLRWLVETVMTDLHRKGIATSADSVVMCCKYIAQGDAPKNDLDAAVRSALEGGGSDDYGT